ncbi:RluA family pseudouridine synthase [Mycoplasmatota bacterium WC44]
MKKLLVNKTNLRLDKFLVDELDFSRMKVKKMIEKELVLVNDSVAKANYKIKLNDEVTVYELPVEEISIEPVDLPINIVFEDSDVLVVNKDTGMVVHPSHGHYDDTLVNALLYHCDDLSEINGVKRPGIVHRIDKDTSGLLMVAKNDIAHNSLVEQLVEKTVTRKYVALVHGVIPHDFGKINAPIGRDPKDRKKMTTVESGKSAVTHFKVLERFEDFTLIECVLETGRTHQIRVHLKFIGYPVVGDPAYGRRKVIGKNGQFLHAKTLGFIHPASNEYVEFDSELPEYFSEFLSELEMENVD